MILGLDLLNRFILMHPHQPIYHITPKLVIIRTKMGLTFSGPFNVEKFSKWKLNSNKNKILKKTLYPEQSQQNVLSNDTLVSVQKKQKLANILKDELVIYEHSEYLCK